MNSPKNIKRILYLILLIFVTNYLANKFYLYSSIWYFDMIMHFLGGFWIGLVCFSFLPSKFLLNNPFRLTFVVLLIVLGVGVGWEGFEFIFNNVVAGSPFNTLDTISDIFFDLAGGTFSILFCFKKDMIFFQNKVK